MTPTLMPVIHARDTNQVLDNAEICVDAGCHNVFLVNHDITGTQLVDLAVTVQEFYPSLHLGVNRLDQPYAHTFDDLHVCIEYVWTDIMVEPPEAYGAGILDYYGSVDFKYQPQSNDLQAALDQAAAYADVVVTSGSGTGTAPAVDKIRNMRALLDPDVPLAIASGITPANVQSFMPYAQVFMVATGISRDFYDIDRTLLRSLRIAMGLAV